MLLYYTLQLLWQWGKTNPDCLSTAHLQPPSRWAHSRRCRWGAAACWSPPRRQHPAGPFASKPQLLLWNHLKGYLKMTCHAPTHFNTWLSTEPWAVSFPWYIWADAHSMMALFMRYWTVSIRTTKSPYIWIGLSIRLMDRPFDAALCRTKKGTVYLSFSFWPASLWNLQDCSALLSKWNISLEIYFFRAKWKKISLLRFDGGWQLLVVSSQNTLARSEQCDPAAALQGLSTLINHHPIEMLRWQELQRPVITSTCRCREVLCNCISSSLQWVNCPPLHWPVLVDKTTSALLRIWVMAAVSLVFNSFLSSVISLFKPTLSPFFCIDFIPTLKEIEKTLQTIQDSTNPGRSRQ